LNLQLENKLALVSGSTAGIGLAIAKALAAEGARVIVNGRSEARVSEAIASIRAKVPTAKLEGLALDLSKADAALQTTKRHPDVDILVNNLGVYEVKGFEQITDAEWLTIIETNFLSGVRLSRHYLPRMKAAGWGRIIFISSEGLGISRNILFDSLLDTPAVAPFLKSKRAKIDEGNYEAEFPLRWMQKDMHLATVSAYESGVAIPVTNAAKELYRLAMREGHAAEDFSAIYDYLTTIHQKLPAPAKAQLH
jgi:NAD(P)-dependent dehydrogenase (short-subunit alcohol dehydrogenase family)